MSRWVLSAAKMKAARLGRNLSLQEAVDLYNALTGLQVSKQSFQQWETGQHKPDPDHLPGLIRTYSLQRLGIERAFYEEVRL